MADFFLCSDEFYDTTKVWIYLTSSVNINFFQGKLRSIGNWTPYCLVVWNEPNNLCIRLDGTTNMTEEVRLCITVPVKFNNLSGICSLQSFE